MPFARFHAGSIRRASSAAVMALLLAGSGAFAQRGAGTLSAPQSTPVSFVTMAQAVEQQDYTVEQLRRFIDPQGQVTTVREQVKVDANGTEVPPCLVTFLGVEGELPGSPLHTKWEQTYGRYGQLFHRHGSFGVRSLGKVQQNYGFYEIGTVVRAGRSAVRAVVFPVSTDKSIWIVDVDAATKVPLYWAEFDLQFRLLAEVEVVVFVDSVVMPAMASPVPTVQHASFAAADSWLGSPAGLIEPQAALSDYAIGQIETRQDPLSGQQRLVVTFTDGVDQFLVSQVPATPDVFSGLLPKVRGGAATGHTIARFQDASMRVLLFWEDGVSFQVAGRGSLTRLDEVAQHVYRQALSTN